MLGYKLVENEEYNKIFREYYMTQGDTFQNQLNFTRKGEIVTPELATSLKFKIANRKTNEIEYEQEYQYNEGIGKWAINIPSSVTCEWEITSHVYEYEVTYANGDVRTLARAKFVVTPQSKEV